MTESDPVVTNQPARSRFEITVDSGTLAGFTAYVDEAEQRIFYHTEIDDAFGGRGLGSVLVRQAVTATRDAGKRIVPVCSYVHRWLDSHAEEAGLADAVDPVTEDAMATVRSAS